MSSIFTPYIMDITGISNAQRAVVSFDTSHPYSVGEIVSLRVSRPYGMVEANNKSARVLDTEETNITLELDTTSFNVFVYPPVGTVVVPAQVVPSASGIIPDYYPPTINLEDVYDNVPA